MCISAYNVRVDIHSRLNKFKVDFDSLTSAIILFVSPRKSQFSAVSWSESVTVNGAFGNSVVTVPSSSLLAGWMERFLR